jgi:hypothetical protein
LIWDRPWSFMKIVFLWVRYFGFLSVIVEFVAVMINEPTVSFCSFWPVWETVGISALLITTEGVLLMWIYVVYDKDLKILMGMGLLFIVEMAAILVILLDSFPSLSAQAQLVTIIPGTLFCPLVNPSSLLNTFWIPVLAYHAVLLILFLIMGYRIYGPTTSRHKVKSKLLRMIYRASFINFLAIFSAYLACAIIWHEDPCMGQVPVGFALTFCVMNCTRLLLNIRLACLKHTEVYSRPIAIEAEICHSPDIHS